MATMNSIMFMPRVISHCGRGGAIVDLSSVLLTFTIVGIILIMLGISSNILHIIFCKDPHAPIHWADIKPGVDNTLLGCLCGVFGAACLSAVVLMSLVTGIYWCIVSL